MHWHTGCLNNALGVPTALITDRHRRRCYTSLFSMIFLERRVKKVKTERKRGEKHKRDGGEERTVKLRRREIVIQ